MRRLVLLILIFVADLWLSGDAISQPENATRFPLVFRFMDWDPTQPEGYQSGMDANSLTPEKVKLSIGVHNEPMKPMRYKMTVREAMGIVGLVLDVEPDYLFEVGKHYKVIFAAQEYAIADQAENKIGSWLPQDDKGTRYFTQNFHLKKSPYGHIFMVDESYKKTLPLVYENKRYYLPWWPGSRYWWKDESPRVREVEALPDNRPQIRHARFSHNTKEILLLTNDTLHAISVENGLTLAKLPLSGSKQLFAAGNSVFADISEGWIEVWDLKSYKPRAKIHLPAVRNADIQLSPQGDLLAVAEVGQNQHGWMTFAKIKIWDTASGQLKITINKPDEWTGQGGLIFLAFSPDGKTLASGSSFGVGDSVGGTLKLWNVQTGELIKTFAQPTAGVGNVAFSSDGQYIGAMRSQGMPDAHTGGPFYGLWEVQSGQLLNNFRFRLDWRIPTQLIILPSGMLLLDKGKSKTIIDPKSGLIMLDNFDVEASNVLARYQNLVLKRGAKSLVLENTKTKRVIKEWPEFR